MEAYQEIDCIIEENSKEPELLWTLEDGDYIDIGDVLRNIFHTPFIKISTDRANWRGARGYKVIDMNTNDLRCQIVPEYECAFDLVKEGDEVYAVVSSHDIPTGAVWKFEGVESDEE